MEELLDKIDFKITENSKNDDESNIKIAIKVPRELGFIERMRFIIETNNNQETVQMHHVKNDDNYIFFEGETNLKTRALYYYFFSFEANHTYINYKKINRDSINTISKDEMWKMSVNFKVPDWAQGKIMYQIFVDRFNRGSKEPIKDMPNRLIHKSWNEDITVGPNENGLWCTDYYGGDLKGITEKLDYIKSLGASIIYLCPVVYAQSNHRYDAIDYEQIDPYAGSEKDLKELCDKAHSMGMHIILDSVFDHTGNYSKYFNQFGEFPELGAYQSNDSKYFPFYKIGYKNGQQHFFHWWGQSNMPVCNCYAKEWQDYIYGEGGVIDKWFKLGIDGLRLDVADELSDEFIEGIRRAVKRNKEDGFILGEVWENPMRKDGRRYLKSGKGMDSVMDYLLMNALVRYYKYADSNFLNHIMKEILREYPEETINSLMNFTATHDMSRVLNVLGSNDFKYHGQWAWDPTSGDNHRYQIGVKLSKEEYELAKKIYKSYLLALTCLPGNLSIYYGDEIGMQGLGNLCNRRPMTWDKIDYDILNNVRELGNLRNSEKFLEKASLEIDNINDNNMSFVRKLGNEEAFISVSRVGNKEKIIIPNSFQDADIRYCIDDSNKKQLSEYGGIVLKKTR